MKKLLVFLFMLFNTTIHYAQPHVYWASKVVSTNDLDKSVWHTPEHALGPPENFENYGTSYYSWVPGFFQVQNGNRWDNYEMPNEVYGVFEFHHAIVPKQLIIYESYNAGSIINISYLEDKTWKEIPVLQRKPEYTKDSQNVWVIPTPNVLQKIKRVKIVCNPSLVKGWNFINSIGICEESTPYIHKLYVAEGKLFTGKRQSLSPVFDQFKDLRSCAFSTDKKTCYANVHHTEKDCDIYISNLKEDNTWTNPTPIGKPINNEGWNFPASVMPCNNVMYIVNRYNDDGSFLDGGVSVSYKTDNGWTQPENIEIENFKNKHKHESYCISHDTKYIVGEIGHDVCYGEGDVYVFIKKSDGKYGPPINLGPKINTAFSEGNPYLASDNKTLFFYSNGHPGYGSGDLYVSRRLDDSWTNWSTPLNLGPELNTAAFEASFHMTSDGAFAYGYYWNDEKNKLDIFKISIEASAKAIRPMPVHFFCGTVRDGNTKKPIKAKVQISDLKSGAIVKDNETNKYNGAFQMMIEDVDGSYSIYAEAPGYIAVRQEYQVKKNGNYTEYPVELFLFPIQKGSKITLNTVYFKQSLADLLPESEPELDNIAELMKANPSMEVAIYGHTDNIGNQDKNLKLSVERAEAVKKYLVFQGVEEKRIKTKGFGGSKPISNNTTEEERKKNRRVEFEILKK